MIYESWYWKRELADLIGEFEAWGPRHVQDHNVDFWYGESGFRLERSLFQSAMAVRRLIDSNKLTNGIVGRSLKLESFKTKACGPHTVRTILGSVDILEWFDMDDPQPLSMSPYTLASEILHSFTLEFLVNDAETDIHSILVASEKNQFVRAVAIPRSEWIGLLRSIVDDRVQQMTVTAREDGRDPTVFLSEEATPPDRKRG
jgi:hypothetical protein